jgi:N-acetylmuramic acid 6-phosphate etherase
MDLDRLPITEILDRISAEDASVAAAVRREIPRIALAVERVTECLREGGRLVYVGAGTSGRLGVLDAAECPPTFGTTPEMIVGVIAGGADALVRAAEGAEDREDEGRKAIETLAVDRRDVVMGIAASWRTPFTTAAVRRARELGATTLYLTTNAADQVELDVDVLIAPEVGPEVVMGSTRMKSATAQKMVLNMITTASMVCLGKVYENMMVDLMATSQKLRERSKRVLMAATGVGYEEAEKRLSAAGGSVKRAVVMIRGEVGAEIASEALKRAGGHVRAALEWIAAEGTEARRPMDSEDGGPRRE